MHDPKVLLLDEPTTGLDPQARRLLWETLKRLHARGLTFILTTHYMEEADRLCHRLAIIDHGTILVEGSPRDLKAGLGGDVISLRLKADGAPVEARKAQARNVLASLAGVQQVVDAEQGVQVIAVDGGAAVPGVLHALDQAGLEVEQLALTRPTLDDVFLKHTGHSIRQEELDTNWRSRRNPFLGRRGRRMG
jgi:ABC-2 type transport system ATP-binding protein